MSKVIKSEGWKIQMTNRESNKSFTGDLTYQYKEGADMVAAELRLHYESHYLIEVIQVSATPKPQHLKLVKI